MQNENDNKVNFYHLGTLALMALIVGSTLGTGIFNIPADMARRASLLPTLTAWLITGLGMYSLVYIFRFLSLKKPHLNSGIFSYAQEASGNYAGFTSAFGYWVSAGVLGNTVYLVIAFRTLSAFFPILSQPLYAFLVPSIFLWLIHFLCLSGIKQSSRANVVFMILKVLGILFFVIVALMFFNGSIFQANAYTPALGSFLDQVKGGMLATVWAFIGIEGASVFSEKARSQRSVRIASLGGFIMVLLLLILVSLISFGLMPVEGIATIGEPATANLLGAVTPYAWAANLMRIVLVISVLGAFLSWQMLGVEIFYSASKGGVINQFFSKVNNRGFSTASLWMMSIAVQFFFMGSFFLQSTYNFLINLTTALILIPYFFSALYALKVLFVKKEYELVGDNDSFKNRLFVCLGFMYTIWLLYASGKFFFIGFVFYGISSILYLILRMIDKKNITRNEYISLFIVCAMALIILAAMITGRIIL